MPTGTALLIALFVAVVAVMTAVHFWIMHTRRTRGTPLLRVGPELALGTRYAFSVPEGAQAVDFFLRHKNGPSSQMPIRLRVHGPVSHEFEIWVEGVWGEHREVLSRPIPGRYEVELSGPPPAEFTELLAVCHPAR